MKISIALQATIFCLMSTQLFARGIEAISVNDACRAAISETENHLNLAPENWFAGQRRSQVEYEQRIRDIEVNEGVMSSSLVPELTGFAMMEQESGNLQSSAALFERALYIVRANEGLYSTRQLPLIDSIIEVNSKIGEWEKVANSYDLMNWLYSRNYDKNDPGQLHALKRLRRWYMESYNKDTGRSLEELFSKSEELYERAIRILWECTGGDEQQTLCFWHSSCCPGAEPVQGVCPLGK